MPGVIRRLHAAVAALLCLTGAIGPARAQTTAPAPRVESISLASAHPMPTVRVPEDLEPVRNLIERSAGFVAEGPMLIAAMTLGQQQFRVTPDQVHVLNNAFKDTYARIAADPAFARVPSVMSHAISGDAARKGHYFLYRPSRVTDDTPVIVFLHGFGGNFQFYTAALKDAFPDSIVIAPTYGIAWPIMGLPFLDEVLDDASRRLDVKLSRPWLVALSAGGPAGFAAYGAAPQRFRGFICLASRPNAGQIESLPRDANVLMLNGTRDDRFPVTAVRDRVQRQTCGMKSFRLMEIDADHFFLLTRTEETFALIW